MSLITVPYHRVLGRANAICYIPDINYDAFTPVDIEPVRHRVPVPGTHDQRGEAPAQVGHEYTLNFINKPLTTRVPGRRPATCSTMPTMPTWRTPIRPTS